MPSGSNIRKGPGPQRGAKSLDTPLEDAEYRQVARWMGEFVPPREIPTRIQETFGKRVNPGFGWGFARRLKWAALIDRYRQEWLVKIAEVPLFHQKYRLERLQRLLDALDGQQEKRLLSAERYERRLLKLLDRARLEVEEKSVEQHTWYFTNLQLNQCTDEELMQRRAELLKRIQQFRLPIRKVTNGVGHGIQVVETSGSDGEADRGGIEVLGDTSDHRPVEGQAPQG